MAERTGLLDRLRLVNAVRTFIKMAAWLSLAAIAYLSVSPPELRPETGAPHNFEHAAAFAICGLAFGLAYRRRPLIIGFLLVVFAGLVELAQMHVPGRHARLTDFLVDAVAIFASSVIASIVARQAFSPAS